MVLSKGARTSSHLRSLLVLTVTAYCIQAANLRASPQSVKQHRSPAAKRAALHAAYDSITQAAGHVTGRQRPTTHAVHTAGCDDAVHVQQLQSQHPQGAVHEMPEEHQKGSWVGIAALSATKPEDKEKQRSRHKKAPRHAHHHSQQSDDSESKSQLQTGFDAEQKKAAVEADTTKNSVGVWNTISQAPKLPDAAKDPGSSSSSSTSASGGTTSSSSSSAVSAGSVTQFTRVLKVTYDGTAKDTGVVQKQSLAAATLEWSLTASSPDFDNPQKAKADGSYGHWQLTIDQEVPLLPASGQHYLKLEGEASYPKSITLKGKLSSVLDKLLSPDAAGSGPSTRMSSQGEMPDSFLASTRSQFAVTACEYSGPCNWAAGPNLGPLLGRLTLSPAVSGTLSIAEMVGKRWMHGGVVELVCVLDAGQEALVDCPHPESGRTSSTYFK